MSRINQFLGNKLWLSPMEGVSDLGFRTICHNRGADLTFTEMIRGSSLIKDNKATLDLVDSFDSSVPTGIQLFVTKKEVLKKSLDMIKNGINNNDGRFSNLSVVDLNFGCPSEEIIKVGGGPAMLKRLSKMHEILTVLKENSPLVCGIKIRLGLNNFEKNQKIYLKVLKIANKVKLDYMTVHPKSATDRSNVPIDLVALSEIIQNAEIPIVGNGFVKSGESAKKMFDLGCSAVMIARESTINPWIFEDIKLELSGQKKTERTKNDYETAWKEYESIAKGNSKQSLKENEKMNGNNYETKEKFYNYHKLIFQLRIKGNLEYHAPSKIMKWV